MLHRLRAHRAFTLIELLVTLALVIVLLSIAVAVSNSSVLDSYKLTNAADKVSQALLTAKARAARDKAPRGVRFIVGPDGFIRDMVYIEQPEPWVPDQGETLTSAGILNPHRSMLVLRFPQAPPASEPFPKPIPTQCRAYLSLRYRNVLNGNPLPVDPARPTDYERFRAIVNQGDLVYSPELRASFTVNINPQSLPADPSGLPPLLANPVPFFVDIDLGLTMVQSPDLAAGQTPQAQGPTATVRTTSFAVHRAPLPLVGEPTMLLSRNVAIDPRGSLPFANLAPPQTIDIVFSPSGHVMNRPEGMICLLVRDVTKFTPVLPPGGNWLTDSTVANANFANAGEMQLVTIFPRTGGITVKPVAEPTPTSPDPYKFARDAIGSGL